MGANIAPIFLITIKISEIEFCSCCDLTLYHENRKNKTYIIRWEYG